MRHVNATGQLSAPRAMPAEVRQLLAPRPKPEYLTSPSQIRWRRLGGPFGPISMVPAGVPVHRQPLAPRDGFQPVVRANATCGHLYLPQRCQWWRDNGRARSSSPEWPLPDTHTASWSACPGRSSHRRLQSSIERAWSSEPWLAERFARGPPACAAAAAVDQALAAATAALASI